MIFRKFAYLQYSPQMSMFGALHCLPVSERVKSFQLRFFGHLARLNPEEDHHRVIAAALRPPSDWRRPASRPRTTWLRTIGRTYSHRISGFTQHGGRQRREIVGIRSSVQQRSARSSPPRRRICLW